MPRMADGRGWWMMFVPTIESAPLLSRPSMHRRASLPHVSRIWLALRAVKSDTPEADLFPVAMVTLVGAGGAKYNLDLAKARVAR